jgi:hypothetical protein
MGEGGGRADVPECRAAWWYEGDQSEDASAAAGSPCAGSCAMPDYAGSCAVSDCAGSCAVSDCAGSCAVSDGCAARGVTVMLM